MRHYERSARLSCLLMMGGGGGEGGTFFALHDFDTIQRKYWAKIKEISRLAEKQYYCIKTKYFDKFKKPKHQTNDF